MNAYTDVVLAAGTEKEKVSRLTRRGTLISTSNAEICSGSTAAAASYFNGIVKSENAGDKKRKHTGAIMQSDFLFTGNGAIAHQKGQQSLFDPTCHHHHHHHHPTAALSQLSHSKVHHASRQPRSQFSAYQVEVLTRRFEQCRYVSYSERVQIGADLAMTEHQVKVWFQNRRTKERRKRENREVEKAQEILYPLLIGCQSASAEAPNHGEVHSMNHHGAAGMSLCNNTAYTSFLSETFHRSRID